jgi:hypothetical protein
VWHHFGDSHNFSNCSNLTSVVLMNRDIWQSKIMWHHFSGGIELDEHGYSTRPPVDWRALWTSFDDEEDNTKHELHFRESTRKGECGLSGDGTHIHFPLFLLGTADETGCLDEDVIEIAKIPVPKVMNKSFFKKMAQLVGFACKDPNRSVDGVHWTCEWDWYSFRDNVLEPNKDHIQSVMGLSDELTERVVHSSDFIINDWDGQDNPDERDEWILSHENFFTEEGLEF